MNKQTILYLLAFFLLPFTASSQVPIPSTCTWPGSQTTTLCNTGIGTNSPEGKLEVKYQPCATQQNGLIITALGCPNSVGNPPINYNFVPTDGLILYNPSDPVPPYVPVTLTFAPAFAVTTATIPLLNPNTKPLFWVRDENIPNGAPGAPVINTYNTRFMILPNGNVGVNTSNPRGTFDVVQFSSDYNNFPTAVFGKIVKGTQTPLMGGEYGTTPSGTYGYRTAQIMIYNRLASQVFNRTVVDGDQAILFTDGKNSNGSNQNGSLVIAPWASDYASSSSVVGGIRINNLGHVQIHGNLRATKLTIDARWWSDNVFYNDYKLLSIDSVGGFIKAHGYLPGMPSEKEILDSGIVVSDMIALQQQKIEELTLYIINQQESIEKLLSDMRNIKILITKD